MKNDSVRKWTLLAVVSAVGLILDVVSKHLAFSHLPYGRPVPLIGQFLQFLLVFNKGAIFGLNPQRIIAGFPVNTVFMAFNFVALAVLIVYYSKINSSLWTARWGISLIMPGALGNLHDRIFRPDLGVVDFIRLGISDRIYWPIFNFADMYVTFGVGFMLLSFYRDERNRVRARLAEAQLPAPGPVSGDSSGGP